MSRIARAFTHRFNHLLGEFGARERQKGVAWIFENARRSAALEHLSLSPALARQNAILCQT